MSSPIDRIEAREIATGPRFLALWEQTALVNVAKAADTLVGRPFGQLNERDFYVLREALAALGKEPA